MSNHVTALYLDRENDPSVLMAVLVADPGLWDPLATAEALSAQLRLAKPFARLGQGPFYRTFEDLTTVAGIQELPVHAVYKVREDGDHDLVAAFGLNDHWDGEQEAKVLAIKLDAKGEEMLISESMTFASLVDVLATDKGENSAVPQETLLEDDSELIAGSFDGVEIFVTDPHGEQIVRLVDQASSQGNSIFEVSEVHGNRSLGFTGEELDSLTAGWLKYRQMEQRTPTFEEARIKRLGGAADQTVESYQRDMAEYQRAMGDEQTSVRLTINLARDLGDAIWFDACRYVALAHAKMVHAAAADMNAPEAPFAWIGHDYDQLSFHPRDGVEFTIPAEFEGTSEDRVFALTLPHDQSFFLQAVIAQVGAMSEGAWSVEEVTQLPMQERQCSNRARR